MNELGKLLACSFVPVKQALGHSRRTEKSENTDEHDRAIARLAMKSLCTLGGNPPTLSYERTCEGCRARCPVIGLCSAGKQRAASGSGFWGAPTFAEYRHAGLFDHSNQRASSAPSSSGINPSPTAQRPVIPSAQLRGSSTSWETSRPQRRWLLRRCARQRPRIQKGFAGIFHTER